LSKNPAVLETLELVRQVADTDATVLIIGESGTGKEIIANMLHERSARHARPMVAVNCGAVAETLQESELFGHVKGAFSGAHSQKIGKFQAAHGGTIYLDEIGEMSKNFQVKLLRILQSGEFAPVGSATNRVCDVRVIAATHQDLEALIQKNSFRKDLYYRLNIIRLHIPPLRNRRQDIPLLTEHFLNIFKKQYGKPDLEIKPETRDLLDRHDYPGNVRELENILRRCVLICKAKQIAPHHLSPEIRSNASAREPMPTNFHAAKARAVGEFERHYLTTLLQECRGIISRAAKRSGLSERNFHEKLKKYNIDGKAFRSVF
jgi:DNA-binding NtrC family response regulator